MSLLKFNFIISEKKTAKGQSMSPNLIAKWQLMKCSGKPVAIGYLASCWTSDFLGGQAKIKCDLSYMTSIQKKLMSSPGMP